MSSVHERGNRYKYRAEAAEGLPEFADQLSDFDEDEIEEDRQEYQKRQKLAEPFRKLAMSLSAVQRIQRLCLTDPLDIELRQISGRKILKDLRAAADAFEKGLADT